MQLGYYPPQLFTYLVLISQLLTLTCYLGHRCRHLTVATLVCLPVLMFCRYLPGLDVLFSKADIPIRRMVFEAILLPVSDEKSHLPIRSRHYSATPT